MVIEERNDDFLSEDEFDIYSKSCIQRFFPNEKFFFIKKYFSNLNKKYYYECSRRKNDCQVKLMFIRQKGVSLFLASDKPHNH